MTFLSKLLTAALTLTLLVSTAAAQTEPADKELAKVRLELAAAQKALTETRQTLEKSRSDLTAAQAKSAEIAKTTEALRKDLASEKAQHQQAVAKFNAAATKTGPTADQAAVQAKLAETIKTAETLRKKLESDNAQLITVAAKLDQVTKAAAKTKADLVVAQKTLTDAKLAKSQAELATAQKALAEARQALSTHQAQLAQADKAREILAKEVATEKAQATAAAAQLELATKEADRTKADLAATQKALTDAKQAKTQKELATNEKTLAETRTAADELRRSLEAEIKSSVAKLEEANRETDLIRKEAAAAAAKLVLTNKDAAQTKVDLRSAQKTLAVQPHLSCTVVVTLPADAKLTFDDSPTISTGARREFTSPPLAVGPTFYYTLKANVVRDGKDVAMEKQVEVRAGERIEVSFALPAAQTIGSRSP